MSPLAPKWMRDAQPPRRACGWGGEPRGRGGRRPPRARRRRCSRCSTGGCTPRAPGRTTQPKTPGRPVGAKARVVPRMNLRVLDAVRGLAAMYVVAFHATNILWPEAPPDSGAFIVAVRQLLGFGHEAVLVFFVVSGFCIHY